jgi:hypothetical protein
MKSSRQGLHDRSAVQCCNQTYFIQGVSKIALQTYRLSIVKHLTEADRMVRKESYMQMFHRIQDDERFLNSVIPSDESTFHANRRTRGSQNPRFCLKHVRDSPKVNVFCALSKERVYGPTFFMETTVIGMLQCYVACGK